MDDWPPPPAVPAGPGGPTYFNSLGMQKCDTIIAVGATPAATVGEGRAQFPDIDYLTIDGSSADAIRDEITGRLS